MTASLVVTIVGPDRPGLVSAVSNTAAEFGANWADSVMANLAGQFAGILHLTVPRAHADLLAAALRGLNSADMQVVVTIAGANAGVASTQKASTKSIKLDLVGQDRPGIIRAISNKLAENGLSIDKLQTQLVSGAMSGEQLFQMHATVSAPRSLDEEALRRALEGLANELMVDITLE
jgi:glycine cleavage system regulatory protein